MRRTVAVLLVSACCCGVVFASRTAGSTDETIYLAKHSGPPPGHAKKGGLPPGLAKQFGPTVPATAYIAVDPKYTDRAYFLIGGAWVLKQGFDSNVQVEVRSLMALPPAPVPPPVPLPSVAVSFHVVLFQ
jgi:hypothetical protein